MEQCTQPTHTEVPSTHMLTSTDANKFIEEEFDYDTLKEITEEDMIQMGVKIGSRRKLLAAIRQSSVASASRSALSSSTAEKNWTIECVPVTAA